MAVSHTLMAQLSQRSTEMTLQQLQGAVTELYLAFLEAFRDDSQPIDGGMQRIARILGIPEQEAALPPDSVGIKSSLAPWQVCKVKTHIEANMQSNLPIQELAHMVRLSKYHFCRAFRGSFSHSPHAYVMRRRIERAQGLMLKADTALCDIATECGFADQAHFNKLFRRFVGETPGAWRRARAVDPG